MSIATYAELQAHIASHLDTDPGGTLIVDFITLGEAKINADLGSIRTAWTSTTLTGTPSSRAITLPVGFVEPRALFLTTYGAEQKLRPFVNGTEELSDTESTPSAWCIADTAINLDYPCDQAHTFKFHYRRKWDIATDTTNWLLSNHPDVYVAASLIEAYDFRENYDAVSRWEGKYNTAKERAERLAGRSQNSVLVADPALLSQSRYFNYTIGS